MSERPDHADRIFGFRTRALHAGSPPDPTTGARAMPIYFSSSFVFDSTEHAAELFARAPTGTSIAGSAIRRSRRSKNVWQV
jgi:O-acetylhomoserine/O-acetylserine sulfhydrylase-like pyridoxal-dependent enzyme